jgi:hypothetical protein
VMRLLPSDLQSLLSSGVLEIRSLKPSSSGRIRISIFGNAAGRIASLVHGASHKRCLALSISAAVMVACWRW